MKDNLKVNTYSNVNFIDINRTSIRGEIKFGKNVKIDINSIFEGHNIIGNNVEIKAGCIIKNSKIGNNTVVKPFTSIEDTTIGANCSIGPYANLRNKNIIKNNVSIGNYVEVKKSNIGNRTKFLKWAFLCGTIRLFFLIIKPLKSIISISQTLGSFFFVLILPFLFSIKLISSFNFFTSFF